MKEIYWFLLLAVAVLVGYGYWQSRQVSAPVSPSIYSTKPIPSSAAANRPSLPISEAVKIDTAELKAVGKFKGSGTATESFDGKIFKHGLTAYLSDPPQDKFYEGWLVKKRPSLVFFSTGKLTKNGGVYSLNYSAPRDERDYEFVVVTQETAALGLDGKPETHVLEGTFWPESFADK